VLRKAPAPSNEQANQVRAFSGQLEALRRDVREKEESSFSVDKDSDRSKKKESKKKKKNDKSRRRLSGDSMSRGSKHHSQLRGCSKSTEPCVKNKCKHCKED
jgi:hypothetical protein